MTTSFLGLSYWELLGTFNREKIVTKRSTFGEKQSHFVRTGFEGLVGHPGKGGVLSIAGIKS